jgi:glycine/D-amino acid oxidase-like deaminating enzyme
MSGQGYDVAVVGAGMGGLTVAGLAARAGRSVILVDRAPRPGGVARDLEIEGFRFEVGGSFLSGYGPGGPLALLLQRLGLSLPIRECDPIFQVALPNHRISLWAEPEAWWREVRREFPGEEAAWRALWSELEEMAAAQAEALPQLPPLPPEGWRARLRIWRALTPGMLSPVPARTGRLLKRALRTPLRATLLRHGLGEASQRVVEAALWYLLLRDAEGCSTLEAAVAIQQVRRGVVAIPGGIMALVDALAEKFRQDGGQLRLETPVDHLLVDGGRIKGLVTAAGETVRARWVVADLPPAVLAGTLLPPRRGWPGRRHALDLPWHPDRITEAMVLAVPEALLPSELCGHCFVVPDTGRPAREENLVFVRTAPASHAGQGDGALRCVTAGRFVEARREPGEQAAQAELLEALDQIVPGVGSAMAFHRVLRTAALAEAWGRPSAAVRYGGESRDWLGRRGLPHRLGWPGLLAVGEWTYPGRLVGNVVEGGMRVAELIAEGA